MLLYVDLYGLYIVLTLLLNRQDLLFVVLGKRFSILGQAPSPDIENTFHTVHKNVSSWAVSSFCLLQSTRSSDDISCRSISV